MNNITRLLLCLSLLIFSSCAFFDRLLVLERLHDNDLEVDFYIENRTDYPIEFYIQHFFGSLESQFEWNTIIEPEKKEALCKSCSGYTTIEDDEIFQHYVVGIIKEDTYVQIKNLDSGAVVKFFAKDTSNSFFFDINNWAKEDRVEGEMTYRKYTLTLTNEIFGLQR